MKTIFFTPLISLTIIVLSTNLAHCQAKIESESVSEPDTNQIAPEGAAMVKPDSTFTDLESELDNLNTSQTKKDTTHIRIGSTSISIYDNGDNIIINKKDAEEEQEEFDEDWSWDDDSDWNFKAKKDPEKYKPHWGGISLGVNNFLTASHSTNLPDTAELLLLNTNKSMEFNINLFQTGFGIYRDYVGITTGVGIKWNNYKFRNPNTVLVSDSVPLYYYEKPEGDNEKSKLATCYLTIPLLLEFHIPTSEETLYLAGGLEGGMKIKAWSKQKTTNDQKSKDHGDFHTPVWDYRATVRAGYGNFGLFATYGLQPVFEKGKGPEVYPFTVGVSLNY